jgi:hypothetical protein
MSNSRTLMMDKRLRAMEKRGRHSGYRTPKDYTPRRSHTHDRIVLRRQAVHRLRTEPMVPSVYVWGCRLYVGGKVRPKLKQGRLFALRIRIQHQCRRGAHGHRA